MAKIGFPGFSGVSFHAITVPSMQGLDVDHVNLSVFSWANCAKYSSSSNTANTWADVVKNQGCVHEDMGLTYEPPIVDQHISVVKIDHED
ncbi:hypothetical protein ACH5RR_035901 [Cinchona calisaya]|uniref:Uncharacterized protein n=1 Tax=Cinchona calisaya TaxID=153742 RepID=A0ABD2Y6D1_9GENT